MAESADTAERAPADRVRDLLSTGYIDVKRARAVELAVPEVREGILDWLAAFAAAGAWRDFEAFANLALHLCPDGLSRVLAPVVAAGTPRVNLDDLVELLADLGPGAADAVPALCSLLACRTPVDGPYYGLCVRVVHALAAVGGAQAREALRALRDGENPVLLRREAAVALGVASASAPDAAGGGAGGARAARVPAAAAGPAVPQ